MYKKLTLYTNYHILKAIIYVKYYGGVSMQNMPKKNEIVKYNNDMNTVRFINFKQIDFDLFMAVCSQMKNKADNVVVLQFDYIMDLIKWDRSTSLKRFELQLKGLSSKLGRLNIVQQDNDGFKQFNIFPTFEVSRTKRTLTVRVNPDLMYFLNNLRSNFTSMDLMEYVDLSGKYTKQIYAQLKQRYHLRDHFWQIDSDKFRELLVIPDSYETKTITQKILNPAVEALRHCKGFEDLTLEVIRDKAPGAPVKSYRFQWTACAKDASPSLVSRLDDNFDDDLPNFNGKNECVLYFDVDGKEISLTPTGKPVGLAETVRF